MLLVSVALAACQLEDRVDLLRITRVEPESASAGDRITVWGEGFPEGRGATVVLQGDVFRPASSPERDVRLIARAKPGPRNAVVFVFDSDFERRLSGTGTAATHATFRGDVRVVFEPAARGVASIAGTYHGVVFDVLPSVVDADSLVQRSREGVEMLAFAGAAAKAQPAARGVELAALDPDGRFYRAGIRAGDRLVEFDGVTVVSTSDLRPLPGERTGHAVVERDGRPLPALPVDVQGIAPPGADSLLGAGALVLAACLVFGFFSSPAVKVFRVFARLMRAKRGTNAGGTLGARARAGRSVLALSADVGPATGVAVSIVLAVIATAFTSMALGHPVLSRDGDLVVTALVPSVALLLARAFDGGFADTRRWTVRGVLGSTGRTLACLLPALFAMAGVVFSTGRFVIEEMVADQGGVPWRCAAFRNPGSLLLLLVLLASAIPESGYGGVAAIEGLEPVAPPRSTSRALVRIAEWTYLFAVCGVGSALFLGGWRVPTVTFMVQESSRRLELLGAGLFLLKCALLLAAVLVTRRVFARVFVEDVWLPFARFGLASSVIGGCIAVGWAAGFDGGRTQLPADILGYAATGLGLVFGSVSLALWAGRGSPPSSISSVNPWI